MQGINDSKITTSCIYAYRLDGGYTTVSKLGNGFFTSGLCVAVDAYGNLFLDNFSILTGHDYEIVVTRGCANIEAPGNLPGRRA